MTICTSCGEDHDKGYDDTLPVDVVVLRIPFTSYFLAWRRWENVFWCQNCDSDQAWDEQEYMRVILTDAEREGYVEGLKAGREQAMERDYG